MRAALVSLSRQCVLLLGASAVSLASGQVPAGLPTERPGQGIGIGQPLPRKPGATGSIVIGGPVSTPPLPSDVELNAISVDPWLVAIVEQLASASFEERVAASDALLKKQADQRQLMALLARPNLDREARARLITALQQRILKAPRGALGVRMESMRDELGVRITGLVPGMPGEKLLRVDDLVYAIDGDAVSIREDLIRIVQSKEPGTTVTISVHRQQRDAKGKGLLDAKDAPLYDKHDFDIALASTETLEVKGGPEPANLLPSPISLEREALAAAVAERFGEKPQLLEAPARVEAEQKARALDQHPVVREALASLELLRKVGGADEATMQLLLLEATKLRKQADRPGVSEVERAHLHALADRVDAIVLEISRIRVRIP